MALIGIHQNMSPTSRKVVGLIVIHIKLQITPSRYVNIGTFYIRVYRN